MRRELFRIIFCALVSILILLIDPDAKNIFNIIILFVVTAIDCIYIYTVHHIDIQRRPEKIKTVYATGITLIIASILLVIIEGIFLVEENNDIYGALRAVSKGYGYAWEFILSIILGYQIYKTMRNFSKSLAAQNTTDWFYENEDKQEEM